MRQSLYLVTKGVPYDVAFSLSASDKAAYLIILGELDGAKFNWSRMEFESER